MKFISRITNKWNNKGVIEAFSSENSFWFASILFRRFLRDGAKIMFDTENLKFSTMINGRLYDITGEINVSESLVGWIEYSKSNEDIIKEYVMF